jgi:hypothetical protein
MSATSENFGENGGTMSDQQTEPRADLPLFSIVIPLEFHRGQWERSWLGWTSQTLDKTAYEIILVVPPDFSRPNELGDLAGAAVRLEFADCAHDIALAAIGAAKARGKYLFLTESHCWPEPDVLELCRQAFLDHSDWAGFSCQSVRISHNRLSEAEADMYQADIDFGMQQHPWRKVLDQCFVTRRDVYEECGGLRVELGHFAEWVLAAAYHARGHTIGYLDTARFHHYYVGALGELQTFTLDFVQGEIAYFSRGTSEVGSDLLEVPLEWSCQDNFDSEMARRIVRVMVGELIADLQSTELWRQFDAIWRWISPALFGDHLVRGASFVAAAYARLVLTVLALAGSREAIARWMKIYIAALIRYQRLKCVAAARRGAAMPRTVLPRLGVDVLAQTGLYPQEQWQGIPFRWSETEAAVRIHGQPGRNLIRIECPAVRVPFDQIGVRFCLDDKRVADEAIMSGAAHFELRLDLPPSGTMRLGWICPPFAAVADPRRLGLPVARIEVIHISESNP